MLRRNRQAFVGRRRELAASLPGSTGEGEPSHEAVRRRKQYMPARRVRLQSRGAVVAGRRTIADRHLPKNPLIDLRLRQALMSLALTAWAHIHLAIVDARPRSLGSC